MGEFRRFHPRKGVGKVWWHHGKSIGEGAMLRKISRAFDAYSVGFAIYLVLSSTSAWGLLHIASMTSLSFSGMSGGERPHGLLATSAFCSRSGWGASTSRPNASAIPPTIPPCALRWDMRGCSRRYSCRTRRCRTFRRFLSERVVAVLRDVAAAVRRTGCGRLQRAGSSSDPHCRRCSTLS